MSSFKSNENVHKKEDGAYYVVSANKASSVTLQRKSEETYWLKLLAKGCAQSTD